MIPKFKKIFNTNFSNSLRDYILKNDSMIAKYNLLIEILEKLKIIEESVDLKILINLDLDNHYVEHYFNSYLESYNDKKVVYSKIKNKCIKYNDGILVAWYLQHIFEFKNILKYKSFIKNIYLPDYFNNYNIIDMIYIFNIDDYKYHIDCKDKKIDIINYINSSVARHFL